MKKIELKEKTAEKKVVPVTLPEGKFSWVSNFCCNDCDYLDKSKKNSYGEYWCGYRSRWVSSGESGCDYGWKNSKYSQ